jgi:anti-sigma factor RsiW
VTDPATCAAFEPDLSALLDGELEPAREGEVRAHVAGCARCADRLARLSRVDETLRALPGAETPGDLAERLRVRLDEERRRVSIRGRSFDSAQARGDDAAPVRSPERPGAGRPVPSRAPTTSQRTPARRRRWIPLAAIAAAAAAALVLYSVLAPDWRRAREESRTAERERTTPGPEVAVREVPAPLPDELVSGPELEAIQAASDDELAVALDLDTLADLDVIERLDVLEQLAALDGAG